MTVQDELEPEAILVGEHEKFVNTGGGPVEIVKTEPPEVPPPGAGLYTVTCAVPTVAMSDAVIDAMICVALTTVVVRLAPFQFTTEPVIKPLPFTVSVKAAPPAVALAGDNELIVGNGFDELIVKVAFPEVPPPGVGLNTVTCLVPDLAMSAAVMAA